VWNSGITDNYEEYPDIHAGSIKECYDDFGFYVNTGLGSLDGILYVKIDIEMHSSEGTWNDYFHVAIYPSGNPYLEYYDHSIDDDNYGESSGDGDGKVEPGETIELKVKLKNTGDAEANNVYAILSTTTSWIDITDNYAQYGDIPAGSIKECNDEYVFHVGNPGGELGRIYPVTFNLDIYSDEGTWSDSFVINVYG
jgi:hypothetical protein